jgi:hypothetical protein
MMFKMNEVHRFRMLVDGEIKTFEGRIVARTYEQEGARHYDFKVGDNIIQNIEEENIDVV